MKALKYSGWVKNLKNKVDAIHKSIKIVSNITGKNVSYQNGTEIT